MVEGKGEGAAEAGSAALQHDRAGSRFQVPGVPLLPWLLRNARVLCVATCGWQQVMNLRSDTQARRCTRLGPLAWLIALTFMPASGVVAYRLPAHPSEECMGSAGNASCTCPSHALPPKLC